MKILFTALILALGFAASAQNNLSGGCGTRTTQQEIDRIYDFVQHNPLAYAKNTAGVIDSIPLSVHIVGNDDGEGYYPLEDLFAYICQLNARYAAVNFHFYIKWPIQYINNTEYYIHDFSSGQAMMWRYNVPNTVNAYFVEDPAGNCGYYSPSADGLAVSKSCATANSNTLIHELGHYFSLPHTFYGWESGNTPSNPEAVRRSGTGANCNAAGDGFCDTYADYLSTRWSCPGPVGRRDQYGDPYHLDSSNYMCYALDGCTSNFSNQQIAAMQYNVHVTRSSFSGAVTPVARPLDSARIVYPVDTLYTNGKTATWRRIPGADYYYVRLAMQDLPFWILESAFSSDTSMNITIPLTEGTIYELSVIPVNAHDVCMKYSTRQAFAYTEKRRNLAVTSAGKEGAQLLAYPNPLNHGSDLQLNFQTLPPGVYTVTMTSVSGQMITEQRFNYSGSSNTYNLNTHNCPDGIYFIRWNGPGGQNAFRVRIGQ